MAILERLAEDRALLVHMPLSLRQRLLVAAGRVVAPTDQEERRLQRAFRRKERQEKRERDHASINATGLRVSRKQPATPLLAAPAASQDNPAPSTSTRALKRFIGGEPMKLATNRLAGRL